jgi:Mrp family chromosome partitioning ATPase/capsular polysaccharide biosynthesis protein
MNTPVLFKPSVGGEAAMDLSAVLNRLWQCRWPAALGATAALLLSIAYFNAVTPYYTASGTLNFAQVEPRSAQAIIAAPSTSSTQQLVDTQVEVLRSLGIAKRVITALGLYEKPQEGLIARLSRRRAPPAPSLNQRYQAYLKDLDVRRKGNTTLIDVAFSDQDAGRAADIVNAVMKEYLNDQIRVKTDAIRNANGWLSDWVTELRQKLAASEKAIQTYKSEEATIDTKVVGATYASFLARLRESQAYEALQFPDARIVSEAAVPDEPARSPERASAIAALVGALLGGLFGLGRQVARTTYGDAGDVSRATKLPVIARLPRMSDDRAREAVKAAAGEASGAAGMADSALSIAAARCLEALSLVAPPTGARCLAVMAADAGKAHATLAAAIGLLAAEVGRPRTVLLDADPSEGAARLVAGLGPSPPPPAADGDGSLVPGFRSGVLLDASAASPAAKQRVISAARSCERLTQLLRGGACDLVVLDAPLLASPIEQRALAAKADAVILVVRLGRARKDDVAALCAAAAGKAVGIVTV